MNFSFRFASLRSTLSALRSPRLISITACMLTLAVGCAEGGDFVDDETDAALSPGSTYDTSSTGYDAGSTPSWTVDASSGPVNTGFPVADAGVRAPVAATDAGGLTLPDLASLFPAPADAGSAPAPTPAASADAGARDVNGPCKDLNLICFDIFDMWINAECTTCNSGKGCQGCALPFAY